MDVWSDDDWHITYRTPITSDVEGWLSWDEVEALLRRIPRLRRWAKKYQD